MESVLASPVVQNEPEFVYERRKPEETALHTVLRENLETFLARVHADPNRGNLPSYVERELRKYLGCGQLDRGQCTVSGLAITAWSSGARKTLRATREFKDAECG